MSDARILPDVQAIDLALSGGGFRATLFHLGVIGYLRDTQNLLERVRTVCSVSGGSILAAHLVINWAEYTNPEIEGFRERARALTDAIRTRDISGDVLNKSRWRLLRLRPLDSEHLVSAYQQLFKAKSSGIRRWDDFRTKTTLPRLHILATHLNTGLACAFSADGFDILRSTKRTEDVASAEGSDVPQPTEDDDQDAIDAIRAVAKKESVLHQDIARSVAASSAFPPVFSPLPLDLEKKPPLHWLTDGGVYDNSGVNYLRHLYEQNKWTEKTKRLVIVSDAGRHFPAELGKAYEGVLGLALRVTDAQGNRIAEADSAKARAYFKDHYIPVVNISIHDRVKHFAGFPAAHSDLVQDLVGTIRTELDAFSAEECLALYRHGYLAAQQAMATYLRDFVRLTGTPWTPVDHMPVYDVDPARKDAPAILLSALGKDVLESRLSTGHINKKQRQLTRLMARSLVGTAVVLSLLAGGIGLAGYLVGTRRREPPAPRVIAEGVLNIVDVDTYGAETWANRIPMLRAITSPPETTLETPPDCEPKCRATARPRYVYLLESEPVSARTGREPYETSAVKVELAGPLAEASIYLFLEEHTADGEVRYIALEQHPDRTQTFILSAGSRENRLRGLVISQTELPVDTFGKNVTLNLERP